MKMNFPLAGDISPKVKAQSLTYPHPKALIRKVEGFAQVRDEYLQ
ncbi:hypothetical protein [Microcoleus sp. FACHB-831]|nr:hypothetical protein [Microcoleus sp. FACHB-831]